MRQSPRVLRSTLPNGVRVVLCPRPHLNQCYVAVFFAVGSRHEPLGRNGITHALEHMLFRGTRRYADATALNAAAEAFGGFLEGATYRDHIMFATACHPRAVRQANEILGEVIQEPRYRGIEVERSVLREELLEVLDGRGRMIDLDNIVHALAFGPMGLGLPIEGNLANLRSFKRGVLEEWRRALLVGRNAVLAAAGPLSDDLLASIARTWGALPAGTPASEEHAAAARPEPQVRFVRNASSQVDMRLSFRGVPMLDPDYPAAVMLSRVLADGLASRIHADLVDRRGLAYALHAGITTYSDCTLFDFDIAVAPNKASRAVRALLDFARAAGRLRYSAAELRRARQRHDYGMQFMEDSPADLVGWYGRAALFGLDEQLETLARRMHRVSGDDLRRVARRIFTRRGLVLAAVGELGRGELKRIRHAVAGWSGCS